MKLLGAGQSGGTPDIHFADRAGRYARGDALVERLGTRLRLTRDAIRMLRVIGDLDVTDLLPRITGPTLVLHAGDAPRGFPSSTGQIGVL